MFVVLLLSYQIGGKSNIVNEYAAVYANIHRMTNKKLIGNLTTLIRYVIATPPTAPLSILIIPQRYDSNIEHNTNHNSQPNGPNVMR